MMYFMKYLLKNIQLGQILSISVEFHAHTFISFVKLLAMRSLVACLWKRWFI